MNFKKEKLLPENFDFGKYLGEGGYGKVYYARKKTGYDNGTICAMKVMKKNNIIKNKKQIDNVELERNILETIMHPFIVKLLYAFESDDSFYLGLEYMRGGDLFHYLEKVHILPEDRACLYTAEVILAIKYLHENKIVYRDLKPDNILLDAQGHIKLSDFGLCKRLYPDKNRAYTFCGTLDYMSPEMVQKRVYNEAVDWWSVGVLLYDMLIGCTPFTVVNNRNMTIQNIKFGKFSFKKTKVNVTPKAKDLICKLLKIQPKERLGSGPKGTMELMTHPFFENINWENLLSRKFEPLAKKIDNNVEEISKRGIDHTDKFISFIDPNKNIFEDFDYVAPNFILDPLITHVRISESYR